MLHIVFAVVHGLCDKPVLLSQHLAILLVPSGHVLVGKHPMKWILHLPPEQPGRRDQTCTTYRMIGGSTPNIRICMYIHMYTTTCTCPSTCWACLMAVVSLGKCRMCCLMIGRPVCIRQSARMVNRMTTHSTSLSGG